MKYTDNNKDPTKHQHTQEIVLSTREKTCQSAIVLGNASAAFPLSCLLTAHDALTFKQCRSELLLPPAQQYLYSTLH